MQQLAINRREPLTVQSFDADCQDKLNSAAAGRGTINRRKCNCTSSRKSHMNPIKINSAAGRLCLAMTRLFTAGPLRRFNQIERAQGNRFDSMENYISDRVSNVSDYRQLFSSFVSFEDKTVLELGCSS